MLVLLVAHGISAGLQFFLMGVGERMVGTRNIDQMGGLASRNPVFSFLFGAAAIMALAVPGTAGFVGEFTVLLSLWDLGPLPALVGGLCLILSASYMLRFVQKVIFGKAAREYEEGQKASALEGVAFGSMLVLLLAFGLHPAFVTNSLRLFEDGPSEEAISSTVIEEEEVETPMTAEEIHQLDSTLEASGFSAEERKALLDQIVGEQASEDSSAAGDSAAAVPTAEQPATAETEPAAAQEAVPQAVDTAKTEASENE